MAYVRKTKFGMSLRQIAELTGEHLSQIKAQSRLTPDALAAKVEKLLSAGTAPEPDSAEFQTHAELADFVTAMSSDIDHICNLIAAARKPLQSASPEIYAAFEPLIELCEKWSRNLNV